MRHTFFIAVVSILFLSGCTLPGGVEVGGGTTTPSGGMKGGILKSTDGGSSYEAKVAAGDKKTIAAVSVLTMVQDPVAADTIYLGTLQHGVVISRNGGELWERMNNFPGVKVYGLAIHPSNSRIIYATAAVDGRGKILKTENGGEEWKEIYSEPSNETVIISLAMDSAHPDTLYAGTSAGIIIKTENGGASWKNLSKEKSPVSGLSIDTADASTVYAALFEKGLLVSRDGGATFTDVSKNISEAAVGGVSALSVSPHQSGTLLAGTTEGVARSDDFGATWKGMDIIGSAVEFPVRAIAVSPFDPNEILFNAAGAVYRSTDSGASWQVYQLTLGGKVGALLYDRFSQGTIYMGVRE